MPVAILTIPPLTEQDIKRFWKYVQKAAPDQCWLWGGAKNAYGYGVFRCGGTHSILKMSHRISMHLTGIEIPMGLCALHHCDVRNCVNPSHLFIGTRRDNMLDKIAKGRQFKGEQLPQAILTEDIVRNIRRVYRFRKHPYLRELAAQYGVAIETIGQVVRKDRWKHVE